MNKNINLINFIDDGWKLVKDESHIKAWSNSTGDVASLNFFNTPPDIPSPEIEENIESIRNMYRELLLPSNGGIISVEIIDIHNIPAIEIILKIPKKPNGMTYIASITLPFEDFSFVIKYECPEQGITGMRDTLVLASVVSQLEKDINGNPVGWIKDPYDSQYDKTAIFNLSDLEKYDSLLPGHPLSRARKYLKNTSHRLLLSSELRSSLKCDVAEIA